MKLLPRYSLGAEASHPRGLARVVIALLAVTVYAELFPFPILGQMGFNVSVTNLALLVVFGLTIPAVIKGHLRSIEVWALALPLLFVGLLIAATPYSANPEVHVRQIVTVSSNLLLPFLIAYWGRRI